MAGHRYNAALHVLAHDEPHTLVRGTSAKDAARKLAELPSVRDELPSLYEMLQSVNRVGTVMCDGVVVRITRSY